VPIAVKDIMDAAGLATEYGSPVYRGHVPTADASCVALARAAGAIVVGKTVTTEFANLTPGPTVNPHNPAHTPGGSSSGSAAAVADGHVPLAFGTQTAGSVIRPASFCGVAGFKPSFNRHAVAGVKPVAQSLDTIGWFATSVEDLALMRSALLAEPVMVLTERQPRIGLCRTHEWRHAAPDTVEAVEGAAAALAAAGASVREAALPALFGRLAEDQLTIMFYEAHRALAFERLAHGPALSAALRERLEAGGRTSIEAYEAAQARSAAGRLALDEVFGGVDVLLAPSAVGEAPLGLASTGDPLFNRIWTLLGVPCVNLPGFTGRQGLPVGVQLIGPIGADRALLAHARWAEGRLG
jgi:Asp-tRNA(Asn)/Glu-tRNA(Gln) amidotransferase A subunit family amidase